MVRLPRISPRTYRHVTRLAVVALAFIVVTGAAVRLTGSGLGCSDWPNCEPGSLVAPLEYHALVEFVNRLVTGLVSIAVILAVLGSIGRDPRRRDLIWLSIGLVAGVLGQIVLGGLTVLFELRPPFVMAHFLLSMVLLWDAVVLHHRAGEPDGAARPIVSRRVLVAGRALAVLTAIVVFVGTIVTASGPHGGDEDAQRFDLSLGEVTRFHGAFAIALLVATIAFLVLLAREHADDRIEHPAQLLLLLLLAQGSVGYVQYFNELPVLLVGIHVTGAVAIWISVLVVNLRLFERLSTVPPAPGRVALEEPSRSETREPV